MGKALIIAEKPSVAADIAKALGGFTKQADFFENDEFVVSSAVGHLLEICPPEGSEVKKGKWSFANLPFIPPRFALRPIERNEARLKVLARLIKRKDVDNLINACDAGREGELIFRHIVRFTEAKQPVRRLWLQSMTPTAIRAGFTQLRSDQDMLPLADAATCRSEADWLVGINGTRAMTAFNSKSGGFYLTTVGRVQTPTLTVVVEREEKIKKFVTREYWELHAAFGAAGGEYRGRWFDENFTREKTKEGEFSDQRSERLWDKAKAEAIRLKCLGQPGLATEESKPSTQISPALFDLTTLQREANSKFGFSAKNTLSIAQALYERHKVLTYPRTDSRALPEDYLPTVRETLAALRETAYRPFADKILEEQWVRPNKRIFNNAKISDHFAIIPTTQAPKTLTEAEQKIYDLVTKRFLAVFYPAAEFLITTRITRVMNEPFKTEGKVLVNPGWLAIYGREVESDETPTLPPIAVGERVATQSIDLQGHQTKPPARFSEATLLSAMENAGKLVEDEELREAMAEKGLGTPATRAAIIEGLINEQYLIRQGKELVPTPKAFSLITLLRGLKVDELCSPELTGEWEHQLRQIQRGQLLRADFMEKIAEMTRYIVFKAKKYESETIPGDFATLKTPCPKCGGVVKENYKKFQCSNTGCDFSLWKVVSGRQFEVVEVEELIREKVVGPLQGFRSKMGRPFAGMIRMTAELKPEFDFGQEKADADGNVAEVDFTGKEPLGLCPKCGARVFEHGMSYTCEKALGNAKSCDFRCAQIILQQPLDRAQVAKLLSTGKTDLLVSFISKKNNRPFKAFLVVGKDKKIGFEFPPRESKAGKKGAGARKKEPEAKIDFTGLQPIGKCPACGGHVFEGPESYVCEKSQAEAKPCKFKVGKIILQQPVEQAQLIKLLKDGRTDLLDKFVSAKTGRPFAAFLVIEGKTKVAFEFPERDA
ncbi:MAG: DNA topoisomerase III [Verrucomicrobia bacterium]|nr:DNA topoisomerase III [Verrucomicrobiota bacterium]MBI3869354.1 DNA topoisomerase III [Verrucomicrobiota bacterium]